MCLNLIVFVLEVFLIYSSYDYYEFLSFNLPNYVSNLSIVRTFYFHGLAKVRIVRHKGLSLYVPNFTAIVCLAIAETH